MTVTVTVVHHALVADSLAVVRDATTRNAEFRRHLERIGTVLLVEAARLLPTHEVEVATPITTTTGRRLSDPPVRGRFKVRSLSDGVVPMHGPMTAGGTAHLGPSAGLEIDGIRINVVSGQCQMLDLDLFRCLGVEPERMKLLVNKSSVHFRAAFAPIAAHILVAVAPGPMAANPAALPWTRLPPGLALHP